ncbi:SRPBCC family protein [Halieaceae bacterium]|nr:SRPBCC family protein [Halieaceae bacterium]
MHEFTVEKTLDVPRDKLWSVVADFANLDWYQGAARVEQEGEGVGQVRRIFMPGMDEPVEEKLLALDPASHTLEYTVLEGAVNIMRDYRVVARLHDADGGGTRASWQASFSGVSVEGVAPEDMISVMQSTYDGMLDAMAAAALSR